MAVESETLLFAQKAGRTVRLLGYVALALFLQYTDYRYHYLAPVQEKISVLLYPLQQLATLPPRWGSHLAVFFSTQSSLALENQRLKQALLIANTGLRQGEMFRRENVAWRELEEFKTHAPMMGQVAEVLYTGRDPFRKSIILNQGSMHGVQLGAAVVDAHGLIGQVTQVRPLTSEVTLLVEKDVPVSVEVSRTGERTIIFGSGDTAHLDVRFLPASSDIRPQDVMLTTGLDNVYPAGIPVAQITGVDSPGSSAFRHVLAKPLGWVSRSRFVLVLKYQHVPLSQTAVDDATNSVDAGDFRVRMSPNAAASSGTSGNAK